MWSTVVRILRCEFLWARAGVSTSIVAGSPIVKDPNEAVTHEGLCQRRRALWLRGRDLAIPRRPPLQAKFVGQFTCTAIHPVLVNPLDAGRLAQRVAMGAVARSKASCTKGFILPLAKEAT
jgi:hypothetical protein